MPPREDSGAGGASSASPSEPAPPPPQQAKAKGKKKDDDLSEEDQALKEKLELYVVRAQDADPGVQKFALESMRMLTCPATEMVDGSQVLYFEQLADQEMTRGMLRRSMDPTWEMRNWNGEDESYIGSRIGTTRDADVLADRSLIRRICSDQGDHSDGNDHFDCQIMHQNFHYPFYGVRHKRCECPCHYNDRRNHRNGGSPWLPGFMSSYDPKASTDFGRVSCWSSSKPVCEKEIYNVGAALYNPCRWTCFLNCILQYIAHTVPLVLKLQKTDHPDPCPGSSVGFCGYCSLKVHIDKSIKLSGSAFYPETFVDCLKFMFVQPTLYSALHISFYLALLAASHVYFKLLNSCGTNTNSTV